MNVTALKKRLDKMNFEHVDFDVFRVFNITEMEIRHSRVLGWLFNPKETHKHGDRYLSRLVSLINENENINEDDKINTKLLSDTFVKCEQKFVIKKCKTENDKLEEKPENKKSKGKSGDKDKPRSIDILLLNKKAKFVIVIENKVNSKQHDGQLEDYEKFINENKKYKDEYKKIFIYLSKNHERGIPDNWIKITYEDLFDAIFLDKDDKKDNLTDAKKFIKSYRIIFSRRFDMYSKEVEESIQIYKDYKEEIDYIYEVAKKEGLVDLDPLGQLIEDVLDEMNKKELNDEDMIIYDSSIYHGPMGGCFLTKRLNNLFPKKKFSRGDRCDNREERDICLDNCYGYWFKITNNDDKKRISLTFELFGEDEYKDQLTEVQMELLKKYLEIRTDLMKNKKNDILTGKKDGIYVVSNKKSEVGLWNQMLHSDIEIDEEKEKEEDIKAKIKQQILDMLVVEKKIYDKYIK